MEQTQTSERLNYTQAARFLGVPIGTVYGWVHRKTIPHLRLGDRLVRFDREALTQWLESHKVAPLKNKELVR
jgi:excisionase family DNA binding protein